MMGVGELLVLIGMMALLVTPIERTLTHRRASQSALFEDALKGAFPFTSPSPPLDALVRQAEDALDRDSLSRGIVATAQTYDGADEQPDT